LAPIVRRKHVNARTAERNQIYELGSGNLKEVTKAAAKAWFAVWDRPLNEHRTWEYAQ
jgi:hypothetical protein